MWSRVELKSRAKIAFKRNYWKCVLVAFVLMLVTEGLSSVSSGGNIVSEVATIGNYAGMDSYEDDYYSDEYSDDYYDEYDDEYDDEYTYYDDSEDFVTESLGGSGLMALAMTIGIVIVLVLVVVGIVLKVFVFNPIEIGGCRFFIENSYEKASAGKLGFAFKKGTYGNAVLTLFLRNLYIALWSLLLIVPGIVKRYEYRLIPYLLADDAKMPREDAFRISKEMMRGQKMEAFILDLSFIGWDLLSMITFGIAGIFWVNPYVQATNAELFLSLRNQYFQGQNNQNAEPQNNEFWSESFQNQNSQNNDFWSESFQNQNSQNDAF